VVPVGLVPVQRSGLAFLFADICVILTSVTGFLAAFILAKSNAQPFRTYQNQDGLLDSAGKISHASITACSPAGTFLSLLAICWQDSSHP